MSKWNRAALCATVCGGIVATLTAGCANRPLAKRSAPTRTVSYRTPTIIQPIPAADSGITTPEPIAPGAQEQTLGSRPALAPVPGADAPFAEGLIPPAPAPAQPMTTEQVLDLWTTAGAKPQAGQGPDVETLDAAETSIEDIDLQSLKALPQLKHLNLRKTLVTDAGLAQLKHVPDLEFLGLSETAVTDGGLADVGRLKQLRYLTLAETAITDEGLRELVGLKQLEGLNLKSTQVTRGGVEALQKELPNCKIVVDESLFVARQQFRQEVAPVSASQPRLVAPGEILSGENGGLVVPVVPDETTAARFDDVLREHFSDPRLLIALGDLYRERGDLQSAQLVYEEALTLTPDDRDLNYRLGLTMADRGDLAGARRHLWRAVGPVVADYNLAVVLHRQDRISESRHMLQQALQVDPTFQPARTLLASLNREGRIQVVDQREPETSPTVGLLLRALQAEQGTTRPQGWQVAIAPNQAKSVPSVAGSQQSTARPATIDRAVMREAADE